MVRIWMILVALFFFTGLRASGIEFYNGSLDAARQHAGLEGKIFMVDFYASWCTPCRWMEETTFRNAELADYVNENVVAVKVNVDDFDGYAWKQQYNVTVLPTILIFNSHGKLIDRVEEAMAPSKLMARLRLHDLPTNRQIVAQPLNSSPSTPSHTNESQKQPYKSSYSKTPYVPKTVTVKTTFRLQMGVFDSYENALTFYTELNAQFMEPIIVLNDLEHGKVTYRLLMGEFITESEAMDYKRILREQFGYDAVVY